MMSTTWGAIKTDRAILSALVCFRLLNGFFLQSTFHPDEEWQSGEVAHSLAFGFGFLTWEWEKCIALRSVAHPAVFAVMFWILKWLHLDFPDLIAVTPRLLQSVVAGLTDYGVIQLAKQWYGGSVTVDSAGDNYPDVHVLRSRKRGTILHTLGDSTGNGLTVTDDARDVNCTALPNSTDRNKPCSVRTLPEAAGSPSKSVRESISQCIARIRQADGLSDVSKRINLVQWIALCSLLSWFNFFCLPRTFSNCFEAFLNVYALLLFAHAQRRENTKVKGPVNARRIAAVKSPDLQGTSAARALSSAELSTSAGRKASAAEETEEKFRKDEDVQEGPGHGKALKHTNGLSLSNLRASQLFHSPTFYTFLALHCAALSVIMRPPAAIFWTVFCLCKISQHLKEISPSSTEDLEGEGAEKRIGKAAIFLGVCLVVGASAVGCNLYLDYLFYRKLTFPPLNFLKFNLFMGPDRYFGGYPWHYYLLECPVVVLLTFYPFFALGVKFWLQTLYGLAVNYYARRVQRTGEKGIRPLEITKLFTLFVISRDDGAALLGTLWSLLLLSLCTHKEYRFMISYMPVLLTYVGIGAAGFVSGNAQLFTALSGQRKTPDILHSRHAKGKSFLTRLAHKQRTTILLVTFGAQVLFAIYFGFFHRRGAPPVMRFLRRLPEESSVFFLSPTHELPYYSQVHRKFRMGFLDCSPRLRHDPDFPEDWQTRFWASEKKTHYLNFLDSFFIPPSNPQQILVSPSPRSQISRISAAPSQSPRVSTCPAPSPPQSLSFLFSPASPVQMSAHPSFESSGASSSSTRPSSASLSRAPRKKELGTVTALESASRLWMRSDIYSQIPNEYGDLPVPFGDFLFGAVKGKTDGKQNTNVASRRGSTQEQRTVLLSSKTGFAEEEESLGYSSAVHNFWFGDAARFRRKLCRGRRWSHSKNCEVTPSFEECLDYRFLVPLQGHLPTHFVLTSGIYEQIPDWFSSRGYVVRLGPIFDSIVAESPRGKVFWQYFYVLERRPPASSVVFA